MSETPTSPEASEAPIEEPPASDPQEEVLARHSANFASVMQHLLKEEREKSSEALDAKLAKINAHIEAEDTDRGELLRILADLNSELNLISGELKAYRQDNVAIRASIDSLAARVDKQTSQIDQHGRRIGVLEKKAG